MAPEFGRRTAARRFAAATAAGLADNGLPKVGHEEDCNVDGDHGPDMSLPEQVDAVDCMGAERNIQQPGKGHVDGPALEELVDAVERPIRSKHEQDLRRERIVIRVGAAGAGQAKARVSIGHGAWPVNIALRDGARCAGGGGGRSGGRAGVSSGAKNDVVPSNHLDAICLRRLHSSQVTPKAYGGAFLAVLVDALDALVRVDVGRVAAQLVRGHNKLELGKGDVDVVGGIQSILVVLVCRVFLVAHEEELDGLGRLIIQIVICEGDQNISRVLNAGAATAESQS